MQSSYLNSGNNYGSAVVIVTDWQFWIPQQSVYRAYSGQNAQLVSSTDPTNSPLSFSFIDNTY
jgi:hypothetical protein